MFDLDSFTLTLAQDSGSAPPTGAALGPSVPTEGPPPTGATGTTGGTGALPRDSSPGFGNLIPLLAIVFVAMIAFSFLGQRRDRKKREAMIGAVKKHDKVQTVGGVIGSVVEVKPDTVILKVDESSNTRMTFARSSIQQVLTSGPDDTSISQIKTD